MICINSRFEMAEAALLSVFAGAFEVKVISASGGDFGDLKGMQFDSERCGGYLYFWSSGTIEYHLVDYELGEEIVPITMRTELEDAGVAATVAELSSTIGNVIGKR